MPKIAILATAVVAAVVLAVVLSSSHGGSGKSGEIFLQAADKTGPDPFTPSAATESSAPPQISPTPAAQSAPANTVRSVGGGEPGLYGGTRNVSSCDVEKEIRFLQAAPAKNKAFASVAGVRPSDVPAYLRSLTPVQLLMDTRVTNHGYRNGTVTGYQAVLQTGTAVLVDGHGMPRVRCACGNPLTAPIPQPTALRPTGDSWPSYRPQTVVVVAPSPQVINFFVLYDPRHDAWFARYRGDESGHKDRPTAPPLKRPTPSVSTLTPTGPSSSAPTSAGPSTPPSSAAPSTQPSSPASSGSPKSPSSPSPPESTPSEPPSPQPETSQTSGSSESPGSPGSSDGESPPGQVSPDAGTD